MEGGHGGKRHAKHENVSMNNGNLSEKHAMSHVATHWQNVIRGRKSLRNWCSWT